jgi:TPP-dependent pyruvate/acetoin dehydrogenase alpha subunit
LRDEISREVADAARRAEASPFPDPAELADAVYAEEAP